ncbi:MAG TPA: fibronectin type III domain-containing protein [Gemmatimonadales bacterium]|nr:fibronectin type III domain-containing protein [Gemmatimonadales bacterium]
MKFTKRFTVRAALVIAAGGLIGALGACKKDDGVGPNPPPPPPPPPPMTAPSALSATPGTGNRVDLAWTDNSTNETGFRVERCSGVGCTTYAQVGANTAANITAFVDTFGLVAATSYNYRVRAFGATAADTSAWSNTATAIVNSPPVPSQILVGAGEITSCASLGSVATANLIKGMLSDPNVTVFTTGNNLTDTVPGSTYADCFAPKWGEFKDRTYFAIGNGDYMGGRGIDGVHEYLGDRTIPKGQLGRSIDIGNWHIILLNTADWEQSSADMQNPNGAMNTWLAADLVNVPAGKCIMAISWERRLYTTSSGGLGVNFNMKQAASLLYTAHADLLVSAKDAIYARFPKTNNDGVAAADGFRQFIVGTGGRSLHQAVTPAGSPVEAQQGNNTPGASNGVIKFKLNQDSYEWEFIPTVPGGFTDKSDAPIPCNQ